MKHLSFALVIILFASCSQTNGNAGKQQAEIDSLQLKLANTYKPGLGEFMSAIQVHHAKLWFAGQEQNWALANFEIQEIQESIDDIKNYCTDRPEIQSLPMITPAIAGINDAIQKKDPELFKQNFITLTNTCNTCHHTVKHEFNVIKIPDTPPFTNQDFKVAK